MWGASSLDSLYSRGFTGAPAKTVHVSFGSQAQRFGNHVCVSCFILLGTEHQLNGVSNVCPLGFGRRFWGGHEKEIAVGLLKMADGNEDVDFGVVLEGGKNNLLNFQWFSNSCGTADGSAVHRQQRLSQMPKVHLWSHSESLNGHWRKAMLCVGLWLEKKTLADDHVSLNQEFKFF